MTHSDQATAECYVHIESFGPALFLHSQACACLRVLSTVVAVCFVACYMSSIMLKAFSPHFVPHADLPAEYSMSPEILGWHEQHDADNVETTANTPEQLQPTVAAGQGPGLQAGHLPASAFKSAQLSLMGTIGKASRVQTPAARCVDMCAH